MDRLEEIKARHAACDGKYSRLMGTEAQKHYHACSWDDMDYLLKMIAGELDEGQDSEAAPADSAPEPDAPASAEEAMEDDAED